MKEGFTDFGPHDNGINHHAVKKETKLVPGLRCGTHAAKLLWYITKDHGVCLDCATALPSEIELLKSKGFTREFRLLDGDDNIYYTGLARPEAEFEPLDEFGTPNAGCTTIEYWDPNKEEFAAL